MIHLHLSMVLQQDPYSCGADEAALGQIDVYFFDRCPDDRQKVDLQLVGCFSIDASIDDDFTTVSGF